MIVRPDLVHGGFSCSQNPMGTTTGLGFRVWGFRDYGRYLKGPQGL